MQLLLALLAVLGVPAIAWLVAMGFYTSSYGATNFFDASFAMADCITQNIDTTDADWVNFCQQSFGVNVGGLIALSTASLGVLLLVINIVLAGIGGTSRSALATTFRLSTVISIFTLAAITFLQTALVSASVIGAFLLVGFIHYFSAIIAVFAPFVLFGSIVNSLFEMFRKQPAYYQAVELTSGTGPEILDFVADVAKRGDLRMPDHVVVGVEPTFFATSQDIILPEVERRLKGETLYLSLPLIRSFTKGELRAVVGHELAHFSGSDTEYSMKFAPAYLSFGQVRHALAESPHWWVRIAALPTLAVINFVLSIYLPAERKISRDREHRADEIGASVSSNEAAASSLVKAIALGSFWEDEFQETAERVVHYRTSQNMSLNLLDRAIVYSTNDRLSESFKRALDEEMAHPFDTHPPTRERVERRGLDPEKLFDPELYRRALEPADSLAKSVQGFDALEQQASRFFQRNLRAMFGLASSSEDRRPYLRYALTSEIFGIFLRVGGTTGPDDVLKLEAFLTEHDFGFDSGLIREKCREKFVPRELDEILAEANAVYTEPLAQKVRSGLTMLSEQYALSVEQNALVARIKSELTGGKQAPDTIKNVLEKASARRRRRR